MGGPWLAPGVPFGARADVVVFVNLLPYLVLSSDLFFLFLKFLKLILALVYFYEASAYLPALETLRLGHDVVSLVLGEGKRLLNSLLAEGLIQHGGRAIQLRVLKVCGAIQPRYIERRLVRQEMELILRHRLERIRPLMTAQLQW